MLIMNVASPLFDKPETRKAVAMAIDSDKLARLAYAEPTGSPFLPHSWANDGTMPARNYHPAEARRLLDSAGWKEGPDGLRARNGSKLTVVMAASKDTQYNPEVARAIADDLKAVGIDLQLALVGHDSFVNDYLGPRAYHLALVNWVADKADPDLFAYWHSSQNTTGFNYTGWANPQADRDLQAALETSDQPTRARLYADFQQQFARDNPAVILYSPLYAYATREPAERVSLPNGDLLSLAQRFDTIANWFLRPGN
jgi:peptide/nickel transport system substrate-binding protein